MLRPATEHDVELIRRWRNHPKVRRASFTTHEIGAEEHRRWWRAVSEDPARLMLIYERDGRRAGVVIFTGLDTPDVPDRDAAVEWSKYVDVDGLGADRGAAWRELEREALAYAFTELGVARIGASTLAANEPVLRLHRENGFTEVRRYQREIDGEPREVVWNELTSARWRQLVAASGEVGHGTAG